MSSLVHNSSLLRNSMLLSALLPLSLTACASTFEGGAATSPGNAETVADGVPFTLQVGQQVLLADSSRLRYLRVVNDSRCPPDVQCVWEGDAIVAFEWSAAGKTEAFELHTGQAPSSRILGARLIRLEALAAGAAPAATMIMTQAGK